ncbi:MULTISPECIES: enoyl-CoA hydratase/isomerase family protein [Haloferax]|uniref:Enoyl-CoA hydratase/isomerase family protein n=2 Tax=Haloferax TaxID=2251 RepID=A0A6G1Z3Y0_9EURY|nr:MULTISPECIES: enoyl-CoA hydratase-related protein [Haloferax]KAB1188559.1 enoyl-CoA hydratase/isomerase family protein [Haloferax sp. CBA1149]MRW81256.1 enoyl-CoA hydratase/isomerase family protein [Haloferax marinisediminis]
MSWETLRLEWDGDVATITIDRPDRMNALNTDTLDALEEALDEAEAEGARVLVLTGAGDKSFIAGADISYMKEIGTPEAQKYAEQGHRIASRLEEFPAPTIAAINGYAFGGGMEFALACDLRVASERALLGQTEIDLGIMPGWGGSIRLPALVGDELARRLIFFGERVDATDAHEYGIVGEVVAHDQLDSHVEELAADLAAKPRHALAGAKAAINMSHDAPRDAALDFEARVWSGLFGTHDQREGMDAFVEKRDPEFE